MKIPKFSAPLTKGIRTTEFYLTLGISVLVAIASSIDPSKLPPKEAGILLAVTNGLFIAQRGLIKAVALLKGIGVEPPASDPKIDGILAVIEAQSKTIEQIAQTTGPTLAKLEAFLAVQPAPNPAPPLSVPPTPPAAA